MNAMRTKPTTFYDSPVFVEIAIPSHHGEYCTHKVIGIPSGYTYRDGSPAKNWHVEFDYPTCIRKNDRKSIHDDYSWSLQHKV